MLIIFDLDGTLIDSVQDLALSASELAVSLGGARLDTATVATMIGEGAPILVRRALQAAGVDPETPGALQTFLEIYNRRLMDHTVVYPGMREALALVARRCRLAVLTNTYQPSPRQAPRSSPSGRRVKTTRDRKK